MWTNTENFVYCMPGFDPGSQSRKRHKEIVIPTQHPVFASCPIDFPQVGRVIGRLAERSGILDGPPRVVTDQWGAQHIEMRLLRPKDGALDRLLLNRQLDSIEIGKGARYTEITFESSQKSVSF